jgi:hypothetical protein
MGSKGLKFMAVLAVFLCMVSCGDGDDDAGFNLCGVNGGYTGDYLIILDITSIGGQCDPGEVPPDPTVIEFDDVTVDWDCDLFFDDFGLLNGQAVLIDLWGDLRDDWMSLITSSGDVITFYVIDFEDDDTIWGIFWWDVTSDCGVEGNFTIFID